MTPERVVWITLNDLEREETLAGENGSVYTDSLRQRIGRIKSDQSPSGGTPVS